MVAKPAPVVHRTTVVKSAPRPPAIVRHSRPAVAVPAVRSYPVPGRAVAKTVTRKLKGSPAAVVKSLGRSRSFGYSRPAHFVSKVFLSNGRDT